MSTTNFKSQYLFSIIVESTYFWYTTPHYVAISNFTSGICRVNENSPNFSTFEKIKC